MSESAPQENIGLKKKDTVSGRVIKTTLAGAVVDIGQTKPAVIPISQLRKEPVRKVEDVVKEGDQIEAWVRRIDTEHDRVELTLIKPLMLEWRDLKKDMVLKGKVSKLEKFGAFIEVGAERPGLVHVSEMSHDYVRSPEDAVKVGEEIEVKVLDVDRRKKQIKLSIKALTPEPAAEVVEPVEPEAEPEKPAPTAMEVALRKAMDSEGTSKPTREKTEKAKKNSPELDDILARTLETREKS